MEPFDEEDRFDGGRPAPPRGLDPDGDRDVDGLPVPRDLEPDEAPDALRFAGGFPAPPPEGEEERFAEDLPAGLGLRLVEGFAGLPLGRTLAPAVHFGAGLALTRGLTGGAFMAALSIPAALAFARAFAAARISASSLAAAFWAASSSAASRSAAARKSRR